MTSEIDAAIRNCTSRRPGPLAVAYLETLVRPVLTERLTVLTVDADVIGEAIDETFRLFAAEVRARNESNWPAWLVATALSFAAEHVSLVWWPDPISANPSVREDRALVFRVILTLGPPCEWLLLTSLARIRPAAASRACEETLKERLNLIAGRYNKP